MKMPEQIASFSIPAISVITITFVAVLIATYSMEHAASDSPELVERGAYLARAGDYSACYIAKEGAPFTGGKPFVLSVGRIYSTNITPDTETGIGKYSMDDFVKVMREGVAKDGHHLYPAMPYPSYAKVSHEDLVALYAFFMQGIKPAHNPNTKATLKWPLGVRSLMGIFNALYLTKEEYAYDRNKSVSWNNGAYLVQGLGHCGACHTPRGIAGQEKASSEKHGRYYLAGAILDNWFASALTGNRETGLYAWSKDDIVEFLKTGRTTRVTASGVMSEVIGKSTQYLTDQDLMAIAEYLKSLEPSDGKGQGNADSAMQAQTAAAAICALQMGDTAMSGSGVYLNNCNACHRSDGSGAKRTFPNLVKNEEVNAKDPISLIHMVLTGSFMPSTIHSPSSLTMPDFGWRLSDTEVANVLSFIRTNWGEHAAEVTSDQVRRVRKSIVVHELEK